MRGPHLLMAALSILAAAATGRAQATGTESLQQLESQLALLREIERVIVTERKGIIAQTNVGIMVVSNEQFNDHVTLQILAGRLAPERADSLVQAMVQQSRAAFQQAIQPEIDHLVAEIGRLRRGMPANASTAWPVGEGPPGTWYIACTGQYPQRFDGRTYSMSVPSHANEFWLVLQRGDGGLLTVGGSPLDSEGRAEGRNEGLKPFGPEVGYGDPGASVEWTAEVHQVRAPAPNVPGVLDGSGRLSFRGPLGTCEGIWSVP